MNDKTKPETVYARVRNTDPGERFFHAEGKQIVLAPKAERTLKMTRAEFENVASLDIDVEEVNEAEGKAADAAAAEAKAAKAPKAPAKAAKAKK